MTIHLCFLLAILHPWPDDFTITYKYKSGTVPPPYKYEYAVCIDAKGNGSIIYTPDVVLDTSWTESFQVKKRALKRYWKFLNENNFFEIDWQEAYKKPVGGSTVILEIFANEKAYKIPAFPVAKPESELFATRTKDLLPQETLKSLSDKREKSIEEYQKK